MNIRGACKLTLALTLMAILSVASRAGAENIDPDADIPDYSAIADSAPPNQVLEIPQQCDQDAVAALCDRSTDSAPSSDADSDPEADFPADADVGSLSDYANESIGPEMSAPGTMNVPVGLYAPAVLAPAPFVVSSGPGDPGTYQQWASGPGAYQSWTRGPGIYRPMGMGPGYIPPMPLGYRPGFGGFGAHPFSAMGGGHFGRR
jgi:hypothetical protein